MLIEKTNRQISSKSRACSYFDTSDDYVHQTTNLSIGFLTKHNIRGGGGEVSLLSSPSTDDWLTKRLSV